jgi:hypothetical protein
MVLPQAMAGMAIHKGTMTGKLNGLTPATTPSACRSDQAPMPGPTFLLCSPLSRASDQGADLCRLRFDQLLEPEQDLRPPRRRRVVGAAVDPMSDLLPTFFPFMKAMSP